MGMAGRAQTKRGGKERAGVKRTDKDVSDVYLSLSVQNTAPQTEQLEQRKFIFSHIWKPEVQGQGVGRVGFF